MEQVQTQIDELRRKIEYHSNRYYNMDDPEITDYEYDSSPVLVDRYIMGRELEVDAICDGKDVFIPGIMEHVEKTGIHSGDSISVYPTFSVSRKAKRCV